MHLIGKYIRIILALGAEEPSQDTQHHDHDQADDDAPAVFVQEECQQVCVWIGISCPLDMRPRGDVFGCSGKVFRAMPEQVERCHEEVEEADPEALEDVWAFGWKGIGEEALCL